MDANVADSAVDSVNFSNASEQPEEQPQYESDDDDAVTITSKKVNFNV